MSARRRLERENAQLRAQVANLHRLVGADVLRLAARLERAEGLLVAHGIDPGPLCRPLTPGDWADRNAAGNQHAVGAPW